MTHNEVLLKYFFVNSENFFRDFSSSALLEDQMQESISTVTNNGEGFLVYCTGNLGITCISYENDRWNVGTAPNKCKNGINYQKII